MSRRPRRARPAVRRIGLLAAAAVVVLTNAAIFAHVAWNRADGPTASLELSDRELYLPPFDAAAFDDDEDTGLGLALQVQHAGDPWDDPWIDREKLGRLGFDVRVDPDAAEATLRYRNVVPREAWMVLELEGAAWDRWLAAREEEVERTRRRVESGEQGRRELRWAENRLAEDRVEASRLFVIDAGPDRDALRERYADPARHAVVPGVVWLRHLPGGEDEPDRLGGRTELTVSRVQVPLRMRAVVERALEERWLREREDPPARRRAPEEDREQPAPVPPVLRAEIAFGRLGEPWLLSVAPLDAEAPEEPASDSHPGRDVSDEAPSVPGEDAGGD